MLKTMTAAALIAGLAAGPALAASTEGEAEAEKQSGVKVGTLTCKVQDVNNIVVYTEQTFNCSFKPANSDETEAYTGEITKIGIDLSIKSDFTIIWAVLAPTDDAYEPKALAGRYIGASADVAAGIGGGAKLLVGAGNNSFSLQPVSVTGVKGAGASIGLESFRLE